MLYQFFFSGEGKGGILEYAIVSKEDGWGGPEMYVVNIPFLKKKTLFS